MQSSSNRWRTVSPCQPRPYSTTSRSVVASATSAVTAPRPSDPLVLGGGLDTLTPPQASRDMAELIPDAELVIIEQIGHLSTIEAPDEVTDILNAYLARLAA